MDSQKNLSNRKLSGSRDYKNTGLDMSNRCGLGAYGGLTAGEFSQIENQTGPTGNHDKYGRTSKEKCMIKIWGRKDSSNVQKVLWCSDELNVGYERVDIGGRFGGNKEKAYLDLNPNGLVPTVEDGGFILWESNSILRYLVEKYGGGQLLSSTLEGRACANRWMDWQLTTLGPAMVPIFRGLVRAPEEKRDLAAIETAVRKAGAVWRILDNQLAKGGYLAGDSFTIGDIPLGVWAYRWFNLPIQRPELKHLSAWYNRLCERTPYQRHIMIPLT
jgi:glutathione S-transferase